MRSRNYRLTEVAQPVLVREQRREEAETERDNLREVMADTAAEEAAQIPKQADKPAACAPSDCLGDKTKGCPESLKSLDKPEPVAPKQNGTEADATVIQSKEEQDSKTSEETKIQEDLKESEDPKKPAKEEEKKEEEVKEEEVKEEPLGPDDVVCDSCIETPCRAIKSCLTCLVSYCEPHLRPHLENPKFQNHRLVEPLRDIERRTCESHNWPLELFCSADACCVCQDCVSEEHRGHNVTTVLEARRRIEVRGTESFSLITATKTPKDTPLISASHVL